MSDNNNISGVADHVHADGGMGSFMQEINQPAKLAADTPAPAPSQESIIPDTGGAWRAKLFGTTTPKSEEQAAPKPVFEEVINEQEKKQEQAKPVDAKTVTLDTMLRVRNDLQAAVLSFMAQSTNPERYKMTDEDLDLLAELWAPYWDELQFLIPKWLPLAIIEVKIMGSLIRRAYNDGKQQKKNTQAVRSGAAAQVVKAATTGNNPNDPSLERRRFEIDSEGYYRHNRDGSFHYAGTPGGELPDLTNAEHVERLIAKNGKPKVMRIFNITDADLEKLGV